jgi:hypothetical protein
MEAQTLVFLYKRFSTKMSGGGPYDNRNMQLKSKT